MDLMETNDVESADLGGCGVADAHGRRPSYRYHAVCAQRILRGALVTVLCVSLEAREWG